jgi:DNA-binding LacI/PurR family transcriptional regulator
VIGFDGVFLDQVSNPKLTTVKQNLFKLGELLAGMILQKIKQDGVQQGEVLIEPELIKSESTRK